MCTVAALAGFAISAASSVVQYQGQVAQANAQEQMYQQNRLNSIQAMNDEVNQINLREQQERQSAGEDILTARRKQQADLASAEVLAGEAGVSGLSVDMLLGDIGNAYDRDIANASSNLDMTTAQLAQQRSSTETTRDNRINSVARGRKPSALGLGLSIAGAGLGSYNQTVKG